MKRSVIVYSPSAVVLLVQGAKVPRGWYFLGITPKQPEKRQFFGPVSYEAAVAAATKSGSDEILIHVRQPSYKTMIPSMNALKLTEANLSNLHCSAFEEFDRSGFYSA